MLLTREILDRIVAGEVELVFRRWSRPSVRVGTRQRTAVGVIEVTSLDEVSLGEITAGDAARAGAGSLDELTSWLDSRVGTIYQIGLRYAGPDPRIALRDTPIETEDEFQAVANRLASYDRHSRWGPWTERVLRAIEADPETPAADLAAHFGREKRLFKADVRKLKELGLTESLNPGYRLSRRGRSLLGFLDND